MDGFDTNAYLTEVRVLERGASDDKRVAEVEKVLEPAGAQIVGMVRGGMRLTAPSPHRILHAGDILVIEAAADTLASVLSALGLKLEASGPPLDEAAETEAEAEQKKPQIKSKAATVVADTSDHSDKAPKDEALDEVGERQRRRSEEIVLVEMVILPGLNISGRSAKDFDLGPRYSLNLLAVSRQGNRSVERLRAMKLRAGDILLLQGAPESISDFASDTGCVPLAERDLQIPNKRKALQASLIMLGSVAVVASGLLPASVGFMAGALLILLLRTLPLRQLYTAVDWPVIVLLGALFPLATAMQSTGTADLIARGLMEHVAQGHATLALLLILLVTMFLTDLMNNAATAAVMCPVAIGSATALNANPDAFLMAVAIGASCAFLTPIGHQNNTMILGPGGFRFGDYWKLGLPLDVLVVSLSMPLLLMAWPL
jgi:Trk K+ transport system NAD-binding subunit